MAYLDETTGLEVVPLVECVRLLESAEVARIAFRDGSRTQMFPINFAWDGEAIVFRTEPDSALAQALDQEVVVEVDATDLRERNGWSVIARGVPHVVDDSVVPELSARLKRLAFSPWTDGDKDMWVRLLPAPLTGRRLPSLTP